ncbi:TolC family protein [Gayadomonas joobiniege]|uniref:TolC family protein n=1 Tax=Gayadomonas joobiniege TaxID=1234606 RepID=UPI00035F0636|nr:TolC family protein [Gayadomonas joobiniege]
MKQTVCWIFLISALTQSVGCSSRSESANLNAEQSKLELPKNWLTSEYQSEKLELLGEFPSELSNLVHIAIKNNQDVLTAYKRIQIAESDLIIADSQLIPDANFSTGWSASQRLDTNQQKTTNTSMNTRLRIGWELDLWNRLGHLSDAAESDWQASVADFQQVQQSLIAALMRVYLDAGLNYKLKEVTQYNLDNQKKRVEITGRRVDLGLAKPLDLYLAQTTLHSIESNLAQYESRYNQNIQRINVMLGRYPSASLPLTFTTPQAPTLNITISPADILNQRPDLKAAELRLAAAVHRWQSSSKNHLPSFNLTADLSNGTNSLSRLLDWQNWLGRLATDIAMPVFNADRLNQLNQKNLTRQEIAWLNYQKKILQAMQEIEAAIVSDYELNKRYLHLSAANEQILASENLLVRQYEQGLASSFEVFNIQNRRINAELSEIRSHFAILNNRVDLTLALGAQFPLKEEENNEQSL